MDRYRRLRRAKAMGVLAVLAVVYAAGLAFVPAGVSLDTVTGMGGVVLGLWVCSHPAANGVDAVFDRDLFAYLGTGEGAGWLVLNAVVMLVGMAAIFLGAMRLTGGR